MRMSKLPCFYIENWFISKFYYPKYIGNKGYNNYNIINKEMTHINLSYIELFAVLNAKIKKYL